MQLDKVGDCPHEVEHCEGEDQTGAPDSGILFRRKPPRRKRGQNGQNQAENHRPSAHDSRVV